VRRRRHRGSAHARGASAGGCGARGTRRRAGDRVRYRAARTSSRAGQGHAYAGGCRAAGSRAQACSCWSAAWGARQEASPPARGSHSGRGGCNRTAQVKAALRMGWSAGQVACADIRARAHTHTHTHARTHAHTHAHTHTRTHTHPHSLYVHPCHANSTQSSPTPRGIPPPLEDPGKEYVALHFPPVAAFHSGGCSEEYVPFARCSQILQSLWSQAQAGLFACS